MFVAIDVQIPGHTDIESSLCITLGVELYKVKGIGGNIGEERNVVLFCHRMVNGDEKFILHTFHINGVTPVAFLGFRRRKLDAAAGH